MKTLKNRLAVFLFVGLFFAIHAPAESSATTDDEKNNISIYRRMSPGVVNITSVVLQRDFFHNPIPRAGAGSGSIIDQDGHILTNHHVIQDSSRVEVTLSDGSKHPAKFVGADPDNDLAVIKIDVTSKKLTVIPMGDSSALKVGQKVLAIGNPFGLGQTLTTGIISSLGRSIQSQSGALIEDLIQTDAAINPGNSGGPLIDSEGNIIGVNSAIISPTGASVGIGFAIPINTAKKILQDLITKGHVSYPWIGVSAYPLIPEFARSLGLKAERGAMIAGVVRGSPSARAGLKGGYRQVRVGNSLIPVGGDVIVEMDGKTVASSEDLVRMIKEHRPGEKVDFRILRNGKFLHVPVTLGEKPVRR